MISIYRLKWDFVLPIIIKITEQITIYIVNKFSIYRLNQDFKFTNRDSDFSW